MPSSTFFDYADSSGARTGLGQSAQGWNTSWKNYSEPESYSGSAPKTSFKDKWGPALSFAKEFAAGLGSRYRDRGDSWGRYPFMEKGTSGLGGQLLDNLAIAYPPQQGPMYIPGSEGSGSTVGGAISGALGGAAAGSTFGPWGAVAGGVLGGIGGLFG